MCYVIFLEEEIMEQEKVYIFGHHSPDTDSVSAAIALAYLKRKQGMNAIPVVLDEISKETEFVLRNFNVGHPICIDNVKLQIKDIDYHKGYFLRKSDSISKVYHYLIDKKITGLPIVDENDTFVGLVTLKMILNQLISSDLKKLTTSYDNIVEVLKGKEVLKFDDEIRGSLMVAGYRSSIFVEDSHITSDHVLIASFRPMIIDYAIQSGVKVIVIVGDQKLDDMFLEKAKEHHVNIIYTSYDTFYTAKLITLANYIETVIGSDRITCFLEDDFYDDFVSMSKKQKYNNYPVIDRNRKCLGLLRLTDIDNVCKKKVMLVDHNEKGQSITGLDEAEILGIVDHHKIGDLTTNNPINFRNMAVGSTNTIIYYLYKEAGIAIPDEIAGVMLSGILSDTLILTSPTTTGMDTEVVESLAEQLDIDYQAYGTEMFKEGTSLKGRTKEEIINQDIKSFTHEGIKYSVSQVFTLDIDSIMKDMDDYLALIEKQKEDMNVHFIVVAITDILSNGSYLLYTKDAKEILEAGYKIEELEEGHFVKDQVSRKKQLVPAIISGINQNK